MAVEGKITQIQMKGARWNDEGEVTAEPYASVTFNVPLNSEEQKNGVLDLMTLVREQNVQIDTVAKQMAFPSMTQQEKQQIEKENPSLKVVGGE